MNYKLPVVDPGPHSWLCLMTVTSDAPTWTHKWRSVVCQPGAINLVVSGAGSRVSKHMSYLFRQCIVTLDTGRHIYLLCIFKQNHFPLVLSISRKWLFQPLHAKLTQAYRPVFLVLPVLLSIDQRVRLRGRGCGLELAMVLFSGFSRVSAFYPCSLNSVNRHLSVTPHAKHCILCWEWCWSLLSGGG